MHADEPADLVHEASSGAVFPGHALGRDVIGTEESVGAMGPDEIRAFFGRHYRPANMVVSAAGRLDHDRVAAELEARLVSSGGGSRPLRLAPGGQPRPLVVTHRPTEQAHLVIAMRAPGRHHRLRWALDVLNHALGGGLSSRLFQEIRERRGLAYAVYSDRVAYDDAGVLSVYVGTAPGKVQEVVALVGEELDRLADKGLTAAELDVARGYLRAQTLLALEDSGARMSRIGRSQLVHGEVLGVTELLAKVDGVSGEDVQEAASEVLASRRSLAVVGPFTEADFESFAVG